MRCLGRRILASVAVVGICVGGGASPANAHGERTQPPWVRTLTATFFDVEFSGTNDRGAETAVAVGEALTVTGKFMLSTDWPVLLGEVRVGYLGLEMPGPVLAVTDKEIGGEFVPGSIVLQRGDSFDFRIRLVGRRPGRWHVHPRLDVEGQGPIVGPGEWVRVRPGHAAYHQDVTLESGGHVDLETYGRATVLGWHSLWIILGLAFSAFWLRKGLLARFIRLRESGPQISLVGGKDRRFAVGVGVLTLALIVGSSAYASSRWANSIPIQVMRDRVPTLPQATIRPDVRLREMVYRIRGQSVSFVLEIENTDQPLTIERLVIGPVTFVTDPTASNEGRLVLAPDTVRAGHGWVVRGSVAAHPLLAERLLARNTPVVKLGGLVVLRGSSDTRFWTPVSADLTRDAA